MNCWHCGRPGVGVCKFCGRCVCKEHAQTKAFILALYPEGDKKKALAVDDVLYCGVCQPKGEPIELTEL